MELLTHGAYAFLEDEADKPNLKNIDIDEIINNNMHRAGKTKSKFNIPDFTDEKFWAKVNPMNNISISALFKRFKKEKKQYASNHNL